MSTGSQAPWWRTMDQLTPVVCNMHTISKDTNEKISTGAAEHGWLGVLLGGEATEVQHIYHYEYLFCWTDVCMYVFCFCNQDYWEATASTLVLPPSPFWYILSLSKNMNREGSVLLVPVCHEVAVAVLYMASLHIMNLWYACNVVCVTTTSCPAPERVHLLYCIIHYAI